MRSSLKSASSARWWYVPQSAAWILGAKCEPQELDKLVSFSGTPTLAWRRTGEICLVGPEFCMLTGWEREELLGRKKYIYEVCPLLFAEVVVLLIAYVLVVREPVRC